MSWTRRRFCDSGSSERTKIAPPAPATHAIWIQSKAEETRETLCGAKTFFLYISITCSIFIPVYIFHDSELVGAVLSAFLGLARLQTLLSILLGPASTPRGSPTASVVPLPAEHAGAFDDVYGALPAQVPLTCEAAEVVPPPTPPPMQPGSETRTCMPTM